MAVQDYVVSSPDIMIIGEAPGEAEAREGRPFVGASGQLLRSMCTHVGIDPRKCYITNVVDTRPPKNDFGVFYEDKGRTRPTTALLSYQAKLKQKISELRPKVVVTVGAEAFTAVSGRKGIEDWRGCPFDFNGIPVIPTYHPAAVLRQYSLHPLCELDLAKALRVSQTGLDQPRFERIICPSKSVVLEWLRKARYKTLSFDIETVGRNLRCVGFARDFTDSERRATQQSGTSISIPLMVFETPPAVVAGSRLLSVGEGSPVASSYWSTEDEMEILTAMAEIFADKETPKLGQNSIAFDQAFIERELNFEFNNHVWDIMHMFHVLYPELPKGLDFFCSVYTDYPNYWTGKNTSDDREEWTYNCWDCIVTLQAYKKIRHELNESELMNLYLRHVYPLTVSLMRAQEYGVEIDVSKRAEMLESTNQAATAALELVKKRAGREDFNPNSSVQLKDIIYTELGFKKQTNRKGKISTDAECLRKLSEAYPEETFFQDLMEYRQASKLADFLQTNLDENNRVHTSYNASGTETGRISSSKNIFGEGMNLMNIPKHVRKIFVPGRGKIFVKADLSQAEARVVAEILKRVGQPDLWHRYQDPSFDMHKWMGAMAFEVPESQISYEMRQLGKVSNHSGNYMAGPPAYMSTAIKYGIKGVTYALAKELRDKRLKAVPGLLVWWKWVEEELRKSRTLTTCLGRRRTFFGRIDNDTLRVAVAFEPQSIVGDVNNIIFRECYRLMRAWDAIPVLQVHDEVVIETPERHALAVINKLREIGKIPLWINRDRPLYIPLDIAVGKTWGECEPV